MLSYGRRAVLMDDIPGKNVPGTVPGIDAGTVGEDCYGSGMFRECSVVCCMRERVGSCLVPVYPTSSIK